MKSSLSEQERFDGVSDKSLVILQAAYDAFAAYGFRRTSMDDIAKAARMSRPALYQTFRNKGDIFRALVSSKVEESCGAVRQILSGEGAFEYRLHNALDKGLIDLHREMNATPHGEELMKLNAEIAGDLLQDWMDRLRKEIEDAFRAKGCRPGISPGDAASIVIHALADIKERSRDIRDLEREIRVLVRVAGALAGR